jgi:hypothetical protein
MESVRTQAQHPPDRLDQVRRRVRRGARIRVATGAAATALAVGLSFVFLSHLGGGSSSPVAAPSPAPSLTGKPASVLRGTQDGMLLIRAVKYDVLNQMARVTFTPTGPHTVIAFSCEKIGALWEMGRLSECGNPPTGRTPKGEFNGGYRYIKTTAGVPVSIDMLATDDNSQANPMDRATLDRYLSRNPRKSGGWTVAVYSGTCTSSTCRTFEEHRSIIGDIPVLLSKDSGTADSKRIPVQTKGRKVELHLVCDAGPAWAVTWLNGKMSKSIPCEAAESWGVFWTEEPGRLEIAVFPASAASPSNLTKSDIAKSMKHPDPMGKWTLQVYDQG